MPVALAIRRFRNVVFVGKGRESRLGERVRAVKGVTGAASEYVTVQKWRRNAPRDSFP